MKLFQNLCYLAHIYAYIYYKVVYYFDNIFNFYLELLYYLCNLCNILLYKLHINMLLIIVNAYI